MEMIDISQKDEELMALITEKGIDAKKFGGIVKQVGLWLWIEFREKPNAETREQMKKEGYKFAPKKKLWYFAGVPCRGKGKPIEELELKYGFTII